MSTRGSWMSWEYRSPMNRRTSIKAVIGSLVLLILGLLAMRAADWYYESSNPIRFGGDIGRAWNIFDLVWVPAFVLSAALFAVSMMFLSKDD